MNFKRIFTAIVSLVLVCCFLVNVSPIKAEAFAIESAVAIGCAAVLSLAACGVIFHPQTQKEIETIGNAFSTYLYQWGTSAEKLTEVDEFIGGLTLYDGSGDNSDDGYDQIWKYAKGGIWGGIAAFIIGAILDNCVKSDGDSADVGFAYYNEWHLPSMPTPGDYTFSYDYQYFAILRQSTYFWLLATDVPITCDISSSGATIHFTSSGHGQYFGFTDGYSSWVPRDSFNSDPSAGLFYPDGLLWSNIDILNTLGELVMSGSQPSNSQPVIIDPDIYVGDIPEKVQNGEYDAETLPLPETIYYGNVIDPDLGAVQSIINLADDLATGKITFEEYITYITPPESEPAPDVTQPEETFPDIEVPEPTIDSDTLSNANPNTFLEQLGAYITAPFRWIWTKIEAYFEPLTRPELWTETIPEIAMVPARWIWEKIETVIAPMLDPDALTRPLPEILASPFQDLWKNMQNAFDSLKQAVGDAPQKVVDGIKEAVVPDNDYLSDKVNALREEFSFADSIVETAQAMHMGLAGVTTEPPVIYIHLENTRGSYNIGGTVPFLDLRWYAEYKPTVDTLISAFLWICFVWHMFLKLPGIISGMPGDFVMDSVHHIGMTESLPTRKSEYEVQRMSNREFIRKGPNK